MCRSIFLLATVLAMVCGFSFGQGPQGARDPAVRSGGESAVRAVGAAADDFDLPLPGRIGEPDAKAALNKVLAAVKTGPMVFLATVEQVQPTVQTQSYPPRTAMNVTVRDVTMLKGKQPAGLTFSYTATEGRDFEPKVGQKVVAVAQATPAPRPRPPQRPGLQGGPRLVPERIIDPPAVPAPPGAGDEMHTPKAQAGPASQPAREGQPAAPGRPLLRLGPPVVGGNVLRVVAMAEATDESVAAVRKALGVSTRPDTQPNRPASQPAGLAGWIRLFADEDWYKRQAGPERLFTGELKAIKVDRDMATTLQRTSYYSLGPRTVYTVAKRVAALDALIGKVVTIRGKVVEMQLEGRGLREIWPGQVREAKEDPHPPEMHPDPPAAGSSPSDVRQLPARPESIRPPIEIDGTP
jgi:hypothetical protein